MNSKETQDSVTAWYSRQDMWVANSATYPKAPNYIDCVLLDVPSMVTGKKVLNLGCCYPSDELQFSETAMEWFAIDLSYEIVKRSFELVKDRSNVIILHMDMKELLFSNNYFDTVLDFSSGDHLLEEDYKKTLTEVHRVLFKDGIFIVTYANSHSFPKINYYGDFGYFRATDPLDMKNWVMDAGFTVLEEIITGDRAGLVAKKV